MNPNSQHCTDCGKIWKPRLYHRIIMLICGEYTYSCSCGCRMKFRLIHHVVKVSSEKLDKKELWKRG